MDAAHKGNFQLATEYLQTHLRGTDAETLAQQFALVLDKRLPARLNQLSESPEGSLLDPLNPNRDVVGTIATDNGDIEIALTRVDDHKAGKIWLFSADTLTSIPAAFEEVNANELGKRLPHFLVANRIVQIPLFEWIIVLAGFPVLYGLSFLLNRGYRLIVRLVWRRKGRLDQPPSSEVLSHPLRLILIGIAMFSMRTEAGLSLLARQFWTDIATIVLLGAFTWLLIRLNARAERLVQRQLRRRKLEGTTSILRLGRRVADLLIIFAGVLSILFLFGINPTPALAGLGVGGIAVALAAQKTLENVIGGASIILDQAVKVGDSLKFGTVQGTVEEIGLRSTVVRTPDRTLVSVPNGQLANMNIEAFSARDKFWFHPTLNLAHGTTARQMELILNRIQAFLNDRQEVERGSFRVRFTALGAYSLDVEVFAYVNATGWEGFLVIQQQLLLGVMHIIEEAGSRIALPSQVIIQGGALAAESTANPPAQVLERPEPRPNQVETVG
ncbi:MAG TPA: mechanosensitive ion channel family protein [Terracidiphilus sp.]